MAIAKSPGPASGLHITFWRSSSLIPAVEIQQILSNQHPIHAQRKAYLPRNGPGKPNFMHELPKWSGEVSNSGVGEEWLTEAATNIIYFSLRFRSPCKCLYLRIESRHDVCLVWGDRVGDEDGQVGVATQQDVINKLMSTRPQRLPCWTGQSLIIDSQSLGFLYIPLLRSLAVFDCTNSWPLSASWDFYGMFLQYFSTTSLPIKQVARNQWIDITRSKFNLQ